MKDNDFTELDRDRNLYALLSQTSYAISKASQKELRKYDMTARKGAVLTAILAIGDKATPKLVAKQLLRERHSIAELMTRMEKQGLIKKVKDLDRKNRWRAVVTEKGMQIYREHGRRESLKRIMSALTNEDREKLRTILHKLRNKALDELGTHPEPEYMPPGW